MTPTVMTPERLEEIASWHRSWITAGSHWRYVNELLAEVRALQARERALTEALAEMAPHIQKFRDVVTNADGRYPTARECEAAMTHAAFKLMEIDVRMRPALSAIPESECQCRNCIDARGENFHGIPITGMRMIVCPDCGNKRCPRATDHRNLCTRSNAYGQSGSIYGGLR